MNNHGDKYDSALAGQSAIQVMAEMEAKRSQIADVLLAALLFYADETNYVVSGISEPPTAPIRADKGARARDAIERLNKLTAK